MTLWQAHDANCPRAAGRGMKEEVDRALLCFPYIRRLEQAGIGKRWQSAFIGRCDKTLTRNEAGSQLNASRGADSRASANHAQCRKDWCFESSQPRH